MKPSPDFERLKKVILHQGESDRLPFYEHYVDDEVIESISGQAITKLDLSNESDIKRYVDILIQFYLTQGYDYVPLERFLELPRNNIVKGDDTAVLSRNEREWQDENEGVITTWDEFDKYPWPKDDQLVDYRIFEYAAKALPDGMKIIGGVAGGVFEYLSWMMGLVPLSLALYDTPDLIQAMVKKITQMILTVDRNVLDICGDSFGALRMGDDLGYKTATMLDPKVLRQEIFPYQKQIVDLAHERGLPFVLHSCGYLEDIMDDLIDTVGIDAKHSFEDAIIPVSEWKPKWSHRVGVLGGVDMDKLCVLGDTELRAYTNDIMDACIPGGNWALGSGNSIANYVPVSNYLAMLEEGRKRW